MKLIKRLLNANMNRYTKRILLNKRIHGTQPDIPLDPLVKTTILKGGEELNTNYFRIPSGVRLNNGDILVFSQMQYSNRSDYVNQDIGYARSSDKGVTWTDKQVFLKTKDVNSRLANPTTIYNEKDGTIVVFATEFFTVAEKLWWTHSDDMWDMYVMVSKDNGYTWTRKSIKQNIIDSRPDEHHNVVMAGLGTGVVLEDETYAVGAEIGWYNGTTNRIQNILLYSIDLETWQVSSGVTPERGDEANIVLLDDNRILLNARNYGTSEPKMRKVFETSNVGETWTPHKTHKTIPENRATMGHTFKIKINGEDYIIFSHMQNETYVRRKLGLSILKRDESFWVPLGSKYIIEPEIYEGYSVMVWNDNYSNELFIVYEKAGDIIFTDISGFLPIIEATT